MTIIPKIISFASLCHRKRLGLLYQVGGEEQKSAQSITKHKRILSTELERNCENA